MGSFMFVGHGLSLLISRLIFPVQNEIELEILKKERDEVTSVMSVYLRLKDLRGFWEHCLVVGLQVTVEVKRWNWLALGRMEELMLSRLFVARIELRGVTTRDYICLVVVI
jgi:hypothetical protein